MDKKKLTKEERDRYKMIRNKLKFKAQSSPIYDEEFWERLRQHIEEAD